MPNNKKPVRYAGTTKSSTKTGQVGSRKQPIKDRGRRPRQT